MSIRRKKRCRENVKSWREKMDKNMRKRRMISLNDMQKQKEMSDNRSDHKNWKKNGKEGLKRE